MSYKLYVVPEYVIEDRLFSDLSYIDDELRDILYSKYKEES